MPDVKTELEKKLEQEKRMEKFNEGLKKLIEETQITIMPTLMCTEIGIRPSLKLRDIAPQEAEPAAPSLEDNAEVTEAPAKKRVSKKKN